MTEKPPLSDEEVREIKAREEAATKGPWQQSYYVRKRNYDHMPGEWHLENEQRESKIIRGPGAVGSSECNPIGLLDSARDEDRVFMIEARQDIPRLLEERAYWRGLVEEMRPLILWVAEFTYHQSATPKARELEAKLKQLDNPNHGEQND